jgi:hypothetical protein
MTVAYLPVGLIVSPGNGEQRRRPRLAAALADLADSGGYRIHSKNRATVRRIFTETWSGSGGVNVSVLDKALWPDLNLLYPLYKGRDKLIDRLIR